MFGFALLDFLLVRKSFREEKRRLAEEMGKPYEVKDEE
jgi:hypothetical protein